jgi:hypothetical protein
MDGEVAGLGGRWDQFQLLTLRLGFAALLGGYGRGRGG